MFMRRLIPLVLGLFSGLAWAQPGVFSLDDLSGAELYERFCASCHGESGRGDGPVAGTLAVHVPDLTRISERYDGFPAGEISQVIDGRAVVVAHGPRYMPIWGYEFWVEEGADITAERAARRLISRLVDYLQTIQEKQP